MSITNVNHLCIKCMREKPTTGVCPFCGFDEAQYEPSPHHLPPRSILNGKYLIGRVLGEGGFGITYIGWDLNLDLKLAIKEYYPTGFVTRTSAATSTVMPYRGEKEEFFSKGRARFIQEAKTIAKFYALPGIVSVRDFFLENGTAYIVMEFVEGETLKQQLARVGGKMNAQEVFDLVRPLLRSLAEMHASGLIHRDISPDNIMITPENNIKLIDFGAARDYLDSGNRSLSVMLKPGFAPEEQYFARGQQGPWTDIYALCATIYRAITGVTPQESVERLRHDELKAPSALGVRLTPAQEAALLKGLSVTQENRWQTVPELYGVMFADASGAVFSAESNIRRSVPRKAAQGMGFAGIISKLRSVPVRAKEMVAALRTGKRFRKVEVLAASALAIVLVISVLSGLIMSPVEKLLMNPALFDQNPQFYVSQLSRLKSAAPVKVEATTLRCQTQIYEYGVKQYDDGKIKAAGKAFALLPSSFLRTEEFQRLDKAHKRINEHAFTWNWGNEQDPDYVLATQLIPISDFHDTGDLLLQQHQTAILFLLGHWSNEHYTFNLEEKPGVEGAFIADTSIPNLDLFAWRIADGKLYHRNSVGVDHVIATLKIIDKDTFQLILEQSYGTYTFTRE